jgi:hypothetical protein
MAFIQLTPREIQEAAARVRAMQPQALDLAWLRITFEATAHGLRVTHGPGDTDEPTGGPVVTSIETLPGPRTVTARYLCDCRCICHAGACGRVIDLDTLDCPRACRSAHMLASDCDLDATRTRQAAHV